ncbi:pleckstrin homology domain-containing family G member 1 [Sorex fumeus]|uniref:pleckstrin homology domain-containing family G member 1 n=1 Tax=Sorex fumeus TaxID=62283 RepID=UPI0024AE2D75|nr:pleckstrin homology domain-containing family G member 1 [Sorex fumeus]
MPQLTCSCKFPEQPEPPLRRRHDVQPSLHQAPSAVTEIAAPAPAARCGHCPARRTMELSDSDRPVSFGSTSSSASSRDSHGSFGSRMTLASSSHLGLFPQDKEAGAIKLELVPARPFSSSELARDSPSGPPGAQEGGEKQPRTPWRAEANGMAKASAQSAASPKLLYVDRVVQEIVETERTYVQDLKSIVEDYLDCIKGQAKLPLGMEERSALFGNIQDIYRFNSELLQDLENCENDPVAIAECFVSKSEEFHIYTQYCTNYPSSVAVLTECMRNKMLAKFFRERQETLKHSLPLGSYLLKPVQRILKYHLLLHEIENHLAKDTEGYDVVLEAIDTMQRVAWHINDMKRKHEHAVRLQEIQSLLTNWKGPDLTSYGELVLEGTFRIQRAKNERTLFLFDKLLLITKKRDDTFTYKAHILCGNLMLVEVIPKEPLSFSVFHYKNPKLQHTVQARSQQDKRLWILHLKRLILENHAAKIPAKAKQAILEMDAIHHPGFCYSPEGETKAFCASRNSSTPYRLRRKSEPSSRTHKVLKTSETVQDIQKASGEEGSPRLPCAVSTPAQRASQPSVGGGGGAALVGTRNIWTDHQIRQALFPSRRSPEDEDDDDYQMFLPCEDGAASRPCSWHLGQMEASGSPGAGHRVVRRASSAGESNTCAAAEVRTRDSGGVCGARTPRVLQDRPPAGAQEEDTTTPFGSSLELTADPLDHVYDNISYEDLKFLVAQREAAETSPPKPSRGSVRPKSTPELAFSKRRAGHEPGSLRPMEEGPLPGQVAAASPSAREPEEEEEEEEEENIYDTIGLPEPAPVGDFRGSSLKPPKRTSFLGLDTDFACCDSLRPFVSQDSLQLSEDEAPATRPRPPAHRDPEYLSGLYGASASTKSLSDKLSEEVDEIWNDLENYIKKNEDKARERLLAAFPVSQDDVPDGPHAQGRPALPSREATRAPSTLSLPGSQPLSSPLKGRPGRAGRANWLQEGDRIAPEDARGTLNRLSLASELSPLGNPYDLVNSHLPQTDPEGAELELDPTDKTKSRVFMMARQYSQKIKKANHLLKVKGPEPEQTPASQTHKPTPRDLAAILEDKKQGGPAIGARIAEYSQLYDQIVFRETPVKMQKDGWATPQPPSGPTASASVSPAQLGNEDWLLNSTYSNGELADFCPQSELDLKSKYPTLEPSRKSTPRKLSTAFSVPSLQTADPLLGSVQRQSVIVSQPNKDTSGQGPLYNSLGRKGLGGPPQPYSRSQSSSSILINKSMESISYPGELGPPQPLTPHMGARGDSLQDLLPRMTESCLQGRDKHSDLTLQDAQKVLVVNRNVALKAQIATQNYFSNFKETEAEEDDYVEIKSEEDEAEFELTHHRRTKSDPKLVDSYFPHSLGSKDPAYALNSPCTPKKPMAGSLGLGPYLTPYNEADRLNDYLWRGPSPTQQNIVQSLREKFQCLSSSSFA